MRNKHRSERVNLKKIFGMLWAILQRRERRNLAVLAGVVLINAAFQTLGVGSIMPFVSAAASDDPIRDNVFVRTIASLVGIETSQGGLILFGVLIISILVLGNALSAFTQYAIIRYSTMRDYAISVRLLGKYLSKDYLFYVGINSAELSRNILAEVRQAINQVLLPTIDALAKAAIAISITTLLVVINPAMALAVGGVLGGGYGLIYLILRKRLLRLGKERLMANRERFKSTAEAFASIKEIKLLHAERVMTEEFATSALRFVKRDAANKMASQLPRYALEAMAFGGVIALMLLYVTGAGGFSSAMPLVSLYAFAGYKLMPALQSVFGGMTQARFGASPLEVLFNDLTTPNVTTDPPTSPGPGAKQIARPGSIRISDVSFSYPERERSAIDQINLEIPAHSMIGIVGETGSGKTTLVDVVLGLLVPSSGAVSVSGVDLSPSTMQSWHSIVGYVPQNIVLRDVTIKENIAFAVPVDQIDQASVIRAAETARIHEFVSRELREGYETIIGERGVRLSGGQRQRIGIARALFRDPEVLLLDEATSALDNRTEAEVMSAIASLSRQKTIIMIAHRISTVKRCDMIYMMSGGRISDRGTYDELMASNDSFKTLAT